MFLFIYAPSSFNYSRSRPARKRINERSSRLNLRSLSSQIAQLKMESIVPAKRIFPPPEIPQYVWDPPVQRTVRIIGQLTNAAATFTVTSLLISQQDGLYYTNSSTARYQTVRPIHIKIWFQQPPSSLTLGSPAVIVTDALSSSVFTDDGTVGQEYACVAYQYPFTIRTVPVGSTNTTPLTDITSSQSITTGQVINLTIDVFVEFR